MPRGIPSLGKNVSDNPVPKAEVLGTLNHSLFTDPTPQGASATWEGPDGKISMEEPPPPWEIDEKSGLTLSDARRFVDVPDNWTLRWINPRLLDQFGWRDWQPVLKSDPRVSIRVDTMVSPEGNIRRGGATGDILAWMYTSWVVSRRKLQQQETDKLTRAAVNSQEELREDMRRGKYGPHVRLEEAKHPTHTMVEGRSIKD